MITLLRDQALARPGVGPDPHGYRREFLELLDLAREVSSLGKGQE